MKEYLQTLISYLLKKPKRKLLRLSFRLKGKVGLEIGGPSLFFHPLGYFPVYFLAKRIDVVNFSAETVWEGKISEGKTFNYFKDKTGHQYIAEATDINQVKDSAYDFVLSSHSLEHVANPLKALFEWRRILKNYGLLVLVLPKKESTFDHKRNYTSISHLIEDFKNETNEKDNTHYEEIINLHDISRDAGVSSKEELVARTLEGFKNRCIHHHVFSFEVIQEMLKYAGFSVLHQQNVHDFHLVTVASSKK